ncbi:MAG: PTS glucose transporter subunit IIA [Cellulomonadaceae bacterium]|nr:PTS glucose transporter subunit IIA [Cellulomonadaceae bacterium]
MAGVTQVRAPLSGQVIPLTEVPDPVFAGGMMGDGVAIIPSQGKLFAPFDGEVAAIFPTGHAVGLRSADGAEILMHIGIDTVALNGKGFKANVVQGQKVRAGDVLVDFDIPTIEAAGYKVVTPVIVTNPDEFPNLARQIATGPITAGNNLYTVSG